MGGGDMNAYRVLIATALGLLLWSPGQLRANSAPPLVGRTVKTGYRFCGLNDYPDYTFYFIYGLSRGPSDEGPEHVVPVTEGQIVRIEGSAAEGKRVSMCMLACVPDGETLEEARKKEGRCYTLQVYSADGEPSTIFAASEERVVTYRVHPGAAVGLERLPDRGTSNIDRMVVQLLALALFVVGIGWVCCRLVRALLPGSR